LDVLIIAQYFPPDLGGSATRAYNVAKGLLLNGCEVTIVAAFPHYPDGKIPREYRWRPLKVEWFGKIRVVRTLMPPMKSKGFFKRILLVGFFAVSSLFAFPFVGKIDVIWASSWLPGIVYSKVKRRPLALNVDDLTLKDLVGLKLLEEDSMNIKIGRLIYRVCYAEGDLVTPISPGYVETISMQYGVEKSKIHVVSGGVDLTVFKPSLSKHNSGGKFTVLYSGAFSVGYDFDQVLKAAKILEAKDGEVEFVLQGKGELVDSIRSKIKELSLKNMRVIDKVIGREDVAELLNQADALILPLQDYGRPYLGISSKLYEYQAVGKPIICCANGQPAEYVKETNSGMVMEPGDHEALAKAAIYLKENLDVAQMMGRNGREYVENNLSIEVIGSQVKEILETLTCKVSGK